MIAPALSLAVCSAIVVVGPLEDGAAERVVPSAVIEDALPKGITLPSCDMALAPRTDDWTRGVLAVWNGDWVLRSIDEETAPAPERDAATDGATASRDALRTKLAAIVERAAANDAPARDRGISTRAIFVAIGPEAPCARLLDVLHACASREVRAARIWLLARDAEGRAGAMPVHLPVDGPTRDRRDEPAMVVWTVGGAAPANPGLPGVGALAAALRDAHGDSKVALTIAPRDVDSPAAPLFAIVNECRRFGFRAQFRAVAEVDEASDAAPHAIAAGAVVTSDPPLEAKDPPPRTDPGKARFGDPRENS